MHASGKYYCQLVLRDVVLPSFAFVLTCDVMLGLCSQWKEVADMTTGTTAIRAVVLLRYSSALDRDDYIGQILGL